MYTINANGVGTLHPFIRRFLFIMRIATFLLLVLFVQVSAHTFGQKVTLVTKNTPLTEVFRQIHAQTAYDFVFTTSTLSDAKPVTLNLQHVELADVLEQVFASQPLEYSVNDKSVVVTKRERAEGLTGRTGLPSEEGETYLVLAYPEVRGRVVDSLGQPLEGASVRVLNAEGKRTTLQTKTDHNGYFELKNVPEGYQLELSYIGHVATTVMAAVDVGTIVLKGVPSELEEVEVMVNTGYQQLPKERATGSFTHIDNQMLNRSVGTDIIARLEGIASGLQFHRQGATGENTENYTIQVRGRATIMSEESPLIVVDNFPFDGNLEDINPNDVESITILKDAAAASIWGARAGNGVIVINTKTGRYDSRATISYNSNWSFVQKPDLYFHSRNFDPPTLMQIHREMYEAGRYDTQLGSDRWYIPPYVELLDQYKNGGISEADFLAMEASMRNTDIRDDITKYLYQTAIKQQHALNVRGGGKTNKYYFSAGYNGDKASMVGNAGKQLTLNFQNTFRPIPALEFTARVAYNLGETIRNASSFTEVRGGSQRLITYQRLVDDDGSYLPYPMGSYRQRFMTQIESMGGVNWAYNPIQEVETADNTGKTNYFMLHGSSSYELPFGLKLDGVYQYSRATSSSLSYYSPQTFFVRDLVNSFLQSDGTRPIPHSGILDGGAAGEIHSHSGRLQLGYNKQLSDNHELAMIAGGEVRQVNSYSLPGFRLYDYHEDLGMGSNWFDYTKRYTNIMGTGTKTIPGPSTAVNLQDVIDRFLSYYANTSYTYKRLYTVSGSIRWDGSNLFGVKTNQKGTPLWSLGGSWNVSQESFYHFTAVPKLKLRATYGSSGNVNKSISTFPVIRYQASSGVDLGLPRIAHLRSPGNPSLRWERVNTFNIAVEFALKNDRVNGGFEYYVKNANDLLGNAVLPPSTGVNPHNSYLTTYTFNYASLKTNGWDVYLNTRNLKGKFQWDTRFLVSYAKDKVMAYYNDDSGTILDYFNDTRRPLIEGRSLNTIYAFPWYGLDGKNGRVLAYIDGQETTDYLAYRESLEPKDLVVAGVPEAPWYGSVLNSFNWKNFNLSFLVGWNFGAVYRRASIFPGREYESASYFHTDLLKKWEKPGDEKHTYVPKGGDLAQKFDNSELQVYTNSEVLISKLDYVNLQDVTLGYRFPKRSFANSVIPAFEIYLYSKNLGYIWKADKAGIDPVTPGSFYPRQRNLALGVRIGF